MRAMLLAAAFLAIDPGLITDAVGLGLICTVCVWNWYVSRAQTSSGE